MNFFAVCYKNTSHIDASCCFLTGIFFFFFFRACQGCRAPAPRRGRARLMESLSWGSVPCAACCKGWPGCAGRAPCCMACNPLHGMHPAAQLASAPSLCPCNAPAICGPKSHRSLLESLQVLMKYLRVKAYKDWDARKGRVFLVKMNLRGTFY